MSHFSTYPNALGRPARGGFAITKSNTVDFDDPTQAIYVGTTGDVAVVGIDDSVVTYVGVPAGAILPVQAKRVNSTNTTASNLVGML